MMENINKSNDILINEIRNIIREIVKISKKNEVKEYFDSNRTEIERVLGKKTIKEIYNILESEKSDELESEKSDEIVINKIYSTIVYFNGRELASEYVKKFSENNKDDLKSLDGSMLPFFKNDNNIENIFKMNTQRKIKILDTNIIQKLANEKGTLPFDEMNSIYMCPIEIVIEFLLRKNALISDERLNFILDNKNILVASSNLKGYDKNFFGKLFNVLNESKNNNNKQEVFKFLKVHQDTLKAVKNDFLKYIRSAIFFMYTEYYIEGLFSIVSVDDRNNIANKIKNEGLYYAPKDIKISSESELYEDMLNYKTKFLNSFKELKNKNIFNEYHKVSFFYMFFDGFINNTDFDKLSKREREQTVKLYYFIFLELKKSLFVSKKTNEIKVEKIDDNTIYDIIISSFTPVYEISNENKFYGNDFDYLAYIQKYESIEIISNDKRIKEYIYEYNLFIMRDKFFETHPITEYFGYTPISIQNYISKLK